MITQASLHTAADPGHGGLSSQLEIVRVGEAYRVSARISRFLPSPGEQGFEPRQWSSVLPKHASEIEAFLHSLLEAHEVFTLQDLATTQAALHPTSHTFRFGTDTGLVHEFRYRIEGGKQLDPRHAALVKDFENFFDKRMLVESFLGAVEGRSTPSGKPWWKFW